MEKTYQPNLFEQRIYENWEQKGYFKANIDPSKTPYTIIMPPPNITGQLHIGHSLDLSLQDCLIRFKRMQGYSALWLPGIDHASIATEVKVVEKLKAQGIDKREIGREAFLKHAWDWKNEYGGIILQQLRKLGASCDWDRQVFTLDEKASKAVKHVFVKLYNEGLIYQGDRIINMCPSCQTALSDAEVEYKERQSHLWLFKYFTPDHTDSITFATTRPETMLGDSAVAVNPTDERYSHLIGKTVVVPFVNREIPIIADEYVEKDFGTGVVKITPAHDPNDFEVGERHNLPVIKVMNDNAVMNELATTLFEGLDRFEARKKITQEMEKLGQLVEIKDYTHNTGECYRCDTIVEPIVSKQWFVSMKPLAKRAIEAVKDGEINFSPSYFEKTYFHWMENIKDWCISRQLWWGHRIPVYYCDNCGEIICSEDTVTVCPKCHSHSIRQDEDVLDTWFSSALWPFSTLGYPDNTPEFKYFYPTNVLVTGYDIIPFWVSRMIFTALKFTNERPFKDVLIHGLVRDEQGRKMSKSLGNGIDPIYIIEKYGADTLRFGLLSQISNSSDIRYSEEKASIQRTFMNKIWNASRFVLTNLENANILPLDKCNLTLADKWILDKLNNLIKEVTINLDNYDIGLASQKLYDFVWNEYCDWYIELSKPTLYGTDEDARTTNLSVLTYCLDKILKLLHPFIPFVTEEIYQAMPNHQETIMNTEFPTFSTELEFPNHASFIEIVKELIQKVRNARVEMDVPQKKRIRMEIKALDLNYDLNESKLYIEKLCNAENIVFTTTPNTDQTVSIVCSCAEIYIPLGDMVDVSKEISRIENELISIESELKLANGKLNNEGFTKKAPPALIEKEREKVTKYTELKQKLQERLSIIKSNQ